jgi:threonine dehydratase
MILSPALSRRYGKKVHLKLESLSPIRSFKHRGALASLSRLKADRDAVLVVTASTGNHGQGVAYAGTVLGIEVVVVAPTTALPEKVSAMRALGAQVELAGSNLSEAQQIAQDLASSSGGHYLEDGEDPALMAGAATVMCEIIESEPAVECVILPVGGGNLIAGSLLACEHWSPTTTIIGVQSTAAPAVTVSWLAGRVEERECTTFAGGLATERPGHLALGVMRRLLADVVLVEESDLYRAVALGLKQTGCLMEGAAAAPLAALEAHVDAITADVIALVVTGSWISSGQLTNALAHAGTRST